MTGNAIRSPSGTQCCMCMSIYKLCLRPFEPLCKQWMSLTGGTVQGTSICSGQRDADGTLLSNETN
eukprot:1161552-Pelagomonas_calceolata.AAC.1